MTKVTSGEFQKEFGRFRTEAHKGPERTQQVAVERKQQPKQIRFLCVPCGRGHLNRELGL